MLDPIINSDTSAFGELDNLPEELIVTILMSSSPEDLVKISRVSRKFHRLANIAELWKKHLTDFKKIEKNSRTSSTTSEKSQFSELYLNNFIRLASRQAEQIDHFLSLKASILAKKLTEAEYKTIVEAYVQLDKYVDKSPAKSFAELVKRHESVHSALAALNCALIEPILQKAAREGTLGLDLSDLGITDIPETLLESEDYAKVWSSIISLVLDRNRLAKLPDNIGICKMLKQLSAHGNKLSALPESTTQLNSLTTLLISSNYILTLPDKLGDLRKLTRIFAGQNFLETLPESLKTVRDLSVIDLTANRLAKVPDFLSQLPLRALGLCSNKLTQIPKALKSLLFSFETDTRVSIGDTLASQKEAKKSTNPRLTHTARRPGRKAPVQ